METLEEMYEKLCTTESDINEHLPIIKKYAEECEHVTEIDVLFTNNFPCGCYFFK